MHPRGAGPGADEPGAGRRSPAAGARLRPPGRLEAFADGVFAIAITLLVLELAVPAVDSHGLLTGLADQWPAFLAYLISFFSIGGVWLSHYGITRTLRGVDEAFLRLNLLLLFFVAFLPYPTKLVAEFLTEQGPERVAVTVYALTFLAISLTVRMLWFYASEHRRLLADAVSDEQIAARNIALTPVLAFYLVAVPVAIALPQVAVAVLAAALAFQAVPVQALQPLVRRGRRADRSPAGRTR